MEIDQGLFIAHVLADERCGRASRARHAAARSAKPSTVAGIPPHWAGRSSATPSSSARTMSASSRWQSAPSSMPRTMARSSRMETGVDLVLLDDRDPGRRAARRVLQSPEIPATAHFQCRHQPDASLLRADFVRRIHPRARAGPAQQDLSRALDAGPPQRAVRGRMSRNRGWPRSIRSPSAAAASCSASWTA